jgi:hypothetical protein
MERYKLPLTEDEELAIRLELSAGKPVCIAGVVLHPDPRFSLLWAAAPGDKAQAIAGDLSDETCRRAVARIAAAAGQVRGARP